MPLCSLDAIYMPHLPTNISEAQLVTSPQLVIHILATTK